MCTDSKGRKDQEKITSRLSFHVIGKFEELFNRQIEVVKRKNGPPRELHPGPKRRSLYCHQCCPGRPRPPLLYLSYQDEVLSKVGSFFVDGSRLSFDCRDQRLVLG